VDVFPWWITTIRGWTVDWGTQRTAVDDQFQSATATVKNAWSRQVVRRTVRLRRKPRPTHRKSLRNRTSSYEPPCWQMAENEWTKLTRLNCVTSETCRRGYTTVYDCPRQTQSISIVFHRNDGKPVGPVFQSGSLCGGGVSSMNCDSPSVAL